MKKTLQEEKERILQIMNSITEQIDHMDDVPLDINDPDKLDKDLTYDYFRNGPYRFGAIDHYMSNDYDEMFKNMGSGKIGIKKEYDYLRNSGNGVIILFLRVYENGWSIVFSISERQKFSIPMAIDKTLSGRKYGVYSAFVFPPDKKSGAFDFAKMEKNDLMNKGFHRG